MTLSPKAELKAQPNRILDVFCRVVSWRNLLHALCATEIRVVFLLRVLAWLLFVALALQVAASSSTI